MAIKNELPTLTPMPILVNSPDSLHGNLFVVVAQTTRRPTRRTMPPTG